MSDPTTPTVLIVAQAGRLTFEAVLFVASLRHSSPNFSARVVVAEPAQGPLWPGDPRIKEDAARDLLARMDAEVIQFESKYFGAGYPNGNKIEALSVLPADEPFLFFDTDTLILGDFAKLPFSKSPPTASMARENTWPTPPLYGPGYTEIWSRLYTEFDVPFENTLDRSFPDEHWERYLYFNAGWIYHSDPRAFQDLMIKIMTWVRDQTPPELASQKLYPWLDQIALPIAIAKAGGGRPNSEMSVLDGDVAFHWRALPLFFAKASNAQLATFDEITAPNKVKKVLKLYEPFLRMIYQKRGLKVRALFDQNNLPRKEQAIRSKIKRKNLWLR